jgi:hypothetical protein
VPGGAVEGLLDDGDLVHEARLVDAGAAAGDLRRGEAQRRSDQRCRRGRVADAHVAADQQLCAGGDLLGRDDLTRGNRLAGLRRCEGVLEVDRATATADLVCRDGGGHSLEIVVDAEVEHPDGHIVLGGEHRDAGLAHQERAHHRRGDGLGECRDAVVGDAVIAREDHRAHAVDRCRRDDPLRRGDPYGQVAESAEGSGRRRETREAFGSSRPHVGRGGGDRLVLVHSAACVGRARYADGAAMCRWFTR